jgi:hypothetical protein
MVKQTVNPIDTSGAHSAAFEARVQALIQASAWALTPHQRHMVGLRLQAGKGAPVDALGRKDDTILVVEAKAFYTPPGGQPSSLVNRQAAMRHGYAQLERSAKMLAQVEDLEFKRSLPPVPRKVWAALVSEEAVPGLDLHVDDKGQFQFLGAFSLGQFEDWLT